MNPYEPPGDPAQAATQSAARQSSWLVVLLLLGCLAVLGGLTAFLVIDALPLRRAPPEEWLLKDQEEAPVPATRP